MVSLILFLFTFTVRMPLILEPVIKQVLSLKSESDGRVIVMWLIMWL